MARDETPSRRLRAAFFESPAAVVGIALFCLVLVVALAAPLISPQNPYDPAQLDALDGRLPPGQSKKVQSSLKLDLVRKKGVAMVTHQRRVKGTGTRRRTVEPARLASIAPEDVRSRWPN